MMLGLSPEALAAIGSCLRGFPEIARARIYGSRAKGNFRSGSDIDLAYESPVDCSAPLLAALDALPLPYMFDVTHYDSIENAELKEHIDRVGVVIYRRDNPLAVTIV